MRWCALCAAFVLAQLLPAMAMATAADDAGGAAVPRHRQALDAGVRRSLADIRLPAVTLVRDDGRSVRLADEIEDGGPVLVSFVYTTCSTICPVTSQTLAEVQQRLGARRAGLHMLSISIDPEQDSPARLRDYARRFGAGPRWAHLTGSYDASVAVQRAFGVDRGDKMNHAAVVFLRSNPGAKWVRLDGVATPEDILRELAPGALAAR
jgi:protein SCO1